MIDNVQLQAALAAVVLGLRAPLELILSAGHDHQPGVGPCQDAVKIGHLYIGLEHDLLAPYELPARRIGQRLDPSPFLFGLGERRAVRLQRAQGVLIAVQAGRAGGLPVLQCTAARIAGLQLCLYRLHVDFRRVFELAGQRRDRPLQGVSLGLAGLVCLLGLFGPTV